MSDQDAHSDEPIRLANAENHTDFDVDGVAGATFTSALDSLGISHMDTKGGVISKGEEAEDATVDTCVAEPEALGNVAQMPCTEQGSGHEDGITGTEQVWNRRVSGGMTAHDAALCRWTR
jgi:hypothetical protein